MFFCLTHFFPPHYLKAYRRYFFYDYIDIFLQLSSKLFKKLKEISIDLIPDELKSYLEEGHKDETVYETKDSETETKLEFLLKQAKKLYDTGMPALK